MLTSLPYSGLKQDGTLTIVHFDRENFNFDSDIKISEEFRYFFNEPSFQGQEDFFPSYSIELNFTLFGTLIAICAKYL